MKVHPKIFRCSSSIDKSYKECTKTFKMLKSFLIQEPILKYPDPSKPYILYTDASKLAW